MTDNTQLTTITENFNLDNIIFTDVIKCELKAKGRGPPIKYQRIPIKVKNDDGTIGDFIVPTSKLFSFGVSENRDPKTDERTGYTLPLCMWNRDGASKEEKEWTDTFDKIVEKCKDHLIDNRKSIQKHDLERSDLKKFNPMYWKKDKDTGLPVEGMVLHFIQS